MKTFLRTTQTLALGLLVFGLLATPATACDKGGEKNDQLQYLYADGYKLIHGDYAAGIPDTLVFKHDRDLNLYKDIAPLTAAGLANVVIEIPQGANEKWETNVDTGRLFWELKKGLPRVVAYVGYPANYGMSPRTLGGDGDPLDVLVLGKMELRGTIAQAQIVGVMRMIDGGDVDDKLIAVLPGTSFAGKTLADLEAMGVTSIIKTWFESYKGPGEIFVTQFEGADAAAAVLAEGMAAYTAANP